METEPFELDNLENTHGSLLQKYTSQLTIPIIMKTFFICLFFVEIVFHELFQVLYPQIKIFLTIFGWIRVSNSGAMPSGRLQLDLLSMSVGQKQTTFQVTLSLFQLLQTMSAIYRLGLKRKNSIQIKCFEIYYYYLFPNSNFCLTQTNPQMALDNFAAILA